MSKDPLYEHFLEISWQRALTPAEQARLGQWLTAHPGISGRMGIDGEWPERRFGSVAECADAEQLYSASLGRGAACRRC